MANLPAIFHDPERWEKPQEFNPSHFLDDDGKFVHREDFMPFGAGKQTYENKIKCFFSSNRVRFLLLHLVLRCIQCIHVWKYETCRYLLILRVKEEENILLWQRFSTVWKMNKHPLPVLPWSHTSALARHTHFWIRFVHMEMCTHFWTQFAQMRPLSSITFPRGMDFYIFFSSLKHFPLYSRTHLYTGSVSMVLLMQSLKISKGKKPGNTYFHLFIGPSQWLEGARDQAKYCCCWFLAPSSGQFW